MLRTPVFHKVTALDGLDRARVLGPADKQTAEQLVLHEWGVHVRLVKIMDAHDLSVSDLQIAHGTSTLATVEQPQAQFTIEITVMVTKVDGVATISRLRGIGSANGSMPAARARSTSQFRRIR